MNDPQRRNLNAAPAWRLRAATVVALLGAGTIACSPAAPAATPATPPASAGSAAASQTTPLPSPSPAASPAASPARSASPSPSAPPAPSPVASPSAAVSTIQLGGVPLDVAAAHRMQEEVDNGHKPWRLHPVEVARADGKTLGFSDDDQFDLVRQFQGEGSGTNHAVVRVVHDGGSYQIQLIQPEKIGKAGIWVINDVRMLK